MHAPTSFDYAVVRIVPRVERGEFVNVGVIVFCRERGYLAARVGVDHERLHALAPEMDLGPAVARVNLIPRICAGDASAGPIATEDQAARFHWLVAPSSTVVQTSPVHSGVCRDPETALKDLYSQLVD